MAKAIEGQLNVAEGVSLYTVKNVVEDPRAVVVIVHGLGEHLGRYEYVVSKLNAFGYSVYRFDNRGHGKSGGERGYLEDFQTYIDDPDRIVAMAIAENPGKPVFMLGHSMGGYITAAYGVKYPGKLRGQVLSGAATIVLPIFEDLKKVDFDATPREMSPNALAHLICRDQHVVDAYVNDPLVLKEFTLKLLGEVFIKGAEWLMAEIEKHAYPCLILHGGNDQIVTPEASRFLYDRSASTDKELKIYDDMFHEILNEFEKDTVLEDIHQWIDARM